MRLAPREVHVWRLPSPARPGSSREDVRDVLSCYVGLPPSQIAFRLAPRGRRPMLVPDVCPGLSFNLAHSGEEALLAVALGHVVGVDIERRRQDVRVDRVIRRFFSDREAEAILCLDAEQQEAAFFRTWVRKEAYLKAIGGGVPARLRRFTVSVGPDEPAVLATELEGGAVSSFSLYDLEVRDGYAGALAVQGAEYRIARFDAGGWFPGLGARFRCRMAAGGWLQLGASG